MLVTAFLGRTQPGVVKIFKIFRQKNVTSLWGKKEDSLPEGARNPHFLYFLNTKVKLLTRTLKNLDLYSVAF